MHTPILPYPQHPSFKDIKGNRFGRLVALYPVGKQGKNYTWLCRCDCGIETVVCNSEMIRGRIQSCGCLQKENRFTHHMSNTPEHDVWARMIHRCCNPNYRWWKNYGGRGITVCNRWKDSFEHFLEDMGKRPGAAYSIDRIDNSLGYFKENCRWATRRQQQNNKRNNRVITYQGDTFTVAQWARRLGMTYGALKNRLSRGWNLDDAMTRPVQKRKPPSNPQCATGRLVTGKECNHDP